jgi:hypothetical protein
VLVDQASTIAPAFGANGTPMAVLVDEEGRKPRTSLSALQTS